MLHLDERTDVQAAARRIRRAYDGHERIEVTTAMTDTAIAIQFGEDVLRRLLSNVPTIQFTRRSST